MWWPIDVDQTAIDFMKKSGEDMHLRTRSNTCPEELVRKALERRFDSPVTYNIRKDT